jgi:hypothetical protein
MNVALAHESVRKRGFSFRSLTVPAHIALNLLIGDSEP